MEKISIDCLLGAKHYAKLFIILFVTAILSMHLFTIL